MTAQSRTALYFLMQFMSGGAFHAYAGIWFNSFGFSANQIASFNTVPIFILLGVNLFAGRIADKAKDWRQALYLASFVSFAASCGLMFAGSYGALLLFWSVSLIAQSIAVPIGDGAALYLTQQGRGDVGTYRALSTVGYIAALFITSIAVLKLGNSYFAGLFAVLTGARFAAAAFMPPFKSSADQHQPAHGLRMLEQIKSTWLVMPVLGWAIVYSTLQVLNTFLSLTLSRQGYGEGMISVLIAVGALTEAIVFFTFQHYSNRFDLRLMIIVSCSVTVVRWIAMTFEPPLAVLLVLQSLHGICFALGFIACITHLSRNTPPENAAEVQSLFTVTQMIAAIFTVTIFGGLTETHGVKAFWGLALIAGAGTAIAMLAPSGKRK